MKVPIDKKSIQSLITWEELNERLNDEIRWVTTSSTVPSIHLISPEGDKVDPQYFSRDNKPHKMRIQELWDQGFTLVLGTVDNLTPRLSQFTGFIEHKFQRAVFTNLYLNSGKTDSKSFQAHVDKTDILICQIMGQTIWGVAGQPEQKLDSGDSLFIQKGILHEARPVQGIPRISLSLAITNHKQPLVDRFSVKLT